MGKRHMPWPQAAVGLWAPPGLASCWAETFSKLLNINMLMDSPAAFVLHALNVQLNVLRIVRQKNAVVVSLLLHLQQLQHV